jgi:TPR repeat protein
VRLQIAVLALSITAAASGEPGVIQQNSAASACEKTEISPQDYQEAVKYFRLSAEQGYAPAQLFLGLVYAAGRGIPKDYNESIKWLRLAANQSNTAAQFYLGGLYFTGTGAPHDYVQAYKWFCLAGKTDPTRASSLEPLARKMSPAQLADAQQQIETWTRSKSNN